MVDKKKVCVIGAGVSGLAAAHAFWQRGHEVHIVERGNDLGGVWEPSRSYPEVQTQSPKDLYRYTSMAMPDDYPEWPKGTQVHAYLRTYAERNGLVPLIRYATKVVSMQRREGAKGWSVELASDGNAVSEDFDFVAVCTGNFSEKRELVHPGQDDFTAAGGQVLHSSEYTDSATVKGKRVVVLGFSKSATDIAVNAVNSGAADVSIVYLEPVWRIPYFIGGLINFKRILYVRAQEVMFPNWDQPLLARLAHTVAKPFVWANWRALESLLSIQLKLKKTGLRPRKPIETTINCSVPIVTPGFFDMVADGRIKAIQGTISGYEQGTVILSGGERVAADMAILAVGWKSGVPFLPLKSVPSNGVVDVFWNTSMLITFNVFVVKAPNFIKKTFGRHYLCWIPNLPRSVVVSSALQEQFWAVQLQVLDDRTNRAWVQSIRIEGSLRISVIA